MIEILEKLLPIFLAFFAAYTAKQLKVLRSSDGEGILKTAFYITIPPLVFISASQIKLSTHLLVFLVLPVILVTASFIAARLTGARLPLTKGQKGVFLGASMAVNSSFVLPFLLVTFGTAGVARVILFNVLHNPLLFIWVYSIAAAHNPERTADKKEVVKKILSLPPLWALILGLVFNIGHIHIAAPVSNALLTIGNLTGILIVIGLGLFFNPHRKLFKITALIVALRMGLGLAIGCVLVLLLHLKGIDKVSLLLLASAPVGFNIVTFATLEKLDEELAANAVSYSIIAGLILAPLILFLAG